MGHETIDTLREKELYSSKTKKAILEIIDALLNIQIKDRNIKLVVILDTS